MTVAVRPPELGDPDAFELQLRKLDGVLAVGFSGTADERIVHVTIADADAVERVRAEADELARLYLGRAVWLIVAAPESEPQTAARRPRRARTSADLDDADAAPLAPDESEPTNGMPHRVELNGIRRHGGRTVEVVLAYAGRRSSAVADGTPTGVAGATIHALQELGFRAPFDVSAAVRLGVGIAGAVAVVLSGADGERLGMARSPASEEAAAKATLHALNRYLDDPRRQLP